MSLWGGNKDMHALKDVDGKEQIIQEYIPLVSILPRGLCLERTNTWNMRT